jgi:DNA processing protein
VGVLINKMEVREQKYWLAWNRVPGVGASRFFKLLEHYGRMEDAWNDSPEVITAIIGAKACTEWLKLKTKWDPEDELEKIAINGYKVLYYSEADYPSNLKKIPDPPPVLYCRGQFKYGDDVAIAIVGTRNPTLLGAYNAKELAMQLSQQGLTIVSGLARGIDTEAHKGAIEAGGRTIAVLGCGIDVVYPKENEALMELVADNGVVISEFALGTAPLTKNFPARNRIISGLSTGVIVVEATSDSGSLITAGFALEQGREVFAVPGSIGNEGSKGPHQLIKQGAKLVEDYHDILSELRIPELAAGGVKSESISFETEIEQKVYSLLKREPQHIDQLIRQSGLTSAQINSTLVQLELKGVVKRFPGQLFLRVT